MAHPAPRPASRYLGEPARRGRAGAVQTHAGYAFTEIGISRVSPGDQMGQGIRKAWDRRHAVGRLIVGADMFGTQPRGGDADGQRRGDILVQRITDIREVLRPYPLRSRIAPSGLKARGSGRGLAPGRPTPVLGQGSEGRFTRPARRRAGPCCWPCRDSSRAGPPAGCCRRHRWRGRRGYAGRVRHPR